MIIVQEVIEELEIDLLKVWLNHLPSWLWGGLLLKFLFDSNERCDKLNLLLQENEAGNTSNIINEECFAITDEVLE